MRWSAVPTTRLCAGFAVRPERVASDLPGKFLAIWNVDFEFQRPADNSEPPTPICMVAREFYSRREVRVFQEELRKLAVPPFDVGDTSLIVAFSAGAEASCFYALGWPMPANVLDLYAEHLVEVNGLGLSPKLNSLLAVLARHGLPGMAATRKDAMRDKIIHQTSWTPEEQTEALDYCAEDVDAGERLLPVMVRKGLIDWERALWRGAYMWASASIEHNGIPVDADLYCRLVGNWKAMQHALIERVDAGYGVYANDSFNRKKFAAWLAANGIPWPRLPSGQLQLEQQVFKSQAEAYPILAPLRELTVTLAQMRSTGLSVGTDGRNRFWLRPLLSRTGRNQPSTSANILGSAAWLRGLVTPPPGHGLALIDWEQQELGIAAGRSGDPRMCEEYRAGDIHMAVAIAARLAPPGATKATHPAARERAKTVSLGTNYGISPYGVALALGIPLVEGRELLEAHKAAYPVFWAWLARIMDTAMLTSQMTAPMGWHLHIVGEPNPRAIQNWIMQASGAEMMRAAVVKMARAGLTLCATAHDAIMILAPLDRLADDVRLAREIMERVSLSFTRRLLVRTEAKVLLPGERLLEPRGVRMWNLVTDLLTELPAPVGEIQPQMIDGSHGYDGSDACDAFDGSDAMGSMPWALGHV